ncbi:hypothetical protein [Calothrix sp. PCC 7507]|uniref:hypothetical protein n=1 Tax=Calothrix sp. PCC 7507 TaxID=99598 RepID=UPI00029F4CE9|nr:hypothetical protein [Calothrix sp. PCC 7507]AFY33269.1 hypothetical protein Cal7507_2854 [Calothrix sp. PCC 7507]
MSQDNQNSQPPSSPEPTPPKPYQRNQPIWKVKIIQVLRGTIGILETAVVKLDTAPPPGAEDTPSFWSGLLTKIRSLLPTNFSSNLSDTALTGILAGIAVILVWTTTTVFSAKPTEIATVPPVEEAPIPTPTIAQPPPESVTVTPEPQPTAEIIPPPEPEPEPNPTPTPAVELTPEQALIAAIKNQVAEISDRFADGLIKSIQANFRTSNLTVKISDDWYTLVASQQDKLANEILQRSQQLDFSHLEIVDSQNRLIARNPIVGNEIVIFKRQIITDKKDPRLL